MVTPAPIPPLKGSKGADVTIWSTLVLDVCGGIRSNFTRLQQWVRDLDGQAKATK